MKKANTIKIQDNKALIVRLNRIEGQIGAIKKMLQSEEECVCMDLLNQVRSASSAMRGVWEVIAARHLENHIHEMDKEERNKTIEEIISCLKELR